MNCETVGSVLNDQVMKFVDNGFRTTPNRESLVKKPHRGDLLATDKSHKPPLKQSTTKKDISPYFEYQITSCRSKEPSPETPRIEAFIASNKPAQTPALPRSNGYV